VLTYDDISMMQDGLDVRWHDLYAARDRLDGHIRLFTSIIPRHARLWEAGGLCKSMEISRVVSYTVQIKSRSRLGITGS
jgi:hypothetical protein